MIAFRALTRDDFPLARGWLAQPHVREWWGSPAPGEFDAEYGPVVDGRDTTRAYIALLDDEPIGFIADPARLGQGLGTRMVRAFMERLFEDARVTRIQVDPSPDNACAIRCYEKAGFRRVARATTPDGPAVLMVAIPPAPPEGQISGS